MPDKDKHFADNAGILKKIKSVLGLNIGTMGDMSVIMPGKVARLMPTAWYMVSAVHRRQNRLLN